MSINDPKFIEDIMKKIDETDWNEVFEREKKDCIQGQLRVANKKYCNWLISFLDNLSEEYESESWAYKTLKHKKPFTKEDENNQKDLHHFYRFLHIVADIQRVKEYCDDRFFEEYEYVFKYNNQYYEYNTLIGQGSITTIKKIQQPEFSFINLDLYFQKEDEGTSQKKYKDNF